MRIAIVAPEQFPVPPLLGGSVEITVFSVAKELALCHSVTVISRSHPRYPKDSFESGVHIHRVNAENPRQYLARVKRWLAGKAFDVIQVDNRPSFVPAIKRLFPTIPVSLFLHSLTFVNPPAANRRRAGPGLMAADIIVANSLSLRHELASRFPDAAGKIRVVWLGVDTQRFLPASGANTSPYFTVLFAGRLIPRKGLHVLLEAVKPAQKMCGQRMRIIVAGSSRRVRYIRRIRLLARRSGVPASFLGIVPHHRIHQIYQQADVLVCPSQKHEAFGLVNVEALSAGLPVVASDIGGIREIVIQGWNGILVPQYTRPQAFAKALAFLAGNPPLLQAMKEIARLDCLNRFSWAATAAHLSRIYEAWPCDPDEI